MQIEHIILKNLIKNEDYMRKVLPFLREEYFHKEDERVLFSTLNTFILEYNELPSFETIQLNIQSKNMTENLFDSVNKLVTSIKTDEDTFNEKWLLDSTETFCQDKAVYNAIMKSIEIMNNKKGVASKGAIPQLLSDALSVSFDAKVGHSYTEDYENRFDYYHRVQEKIPFDLEFFNRITKGGVPKKTLNIALAGCVHPKTKVKVRFRKKNTDSLS